ncbi:hypothetical protein [Tianweitania sediminis]|uniref:Uncharacterized protein n=1 Tax=Tianweitania sediminis TaxID=1502156 RepID=A0A8J7R2X7_9HYPH|nr:hypothetical protein [Tianweitania sediminis]MBP0439918.1 hypothetical protein [Tianweitania sediminis]
MIARIGIAFAIALSSSGAFADERLDAYSECWEKVATADVPDATGKALERALDALVDRANKACNRLAREAAKTNGKDAVNEMWRYMEVQFYNANLRESGD